MNFEKACKFLNLAKSVSAFSKDPSTKVGAVLIGPDGEGGPWGYNGAPRGCAADEDERIHQRPEKYFWMEHAERNAIFTAARSGFLTKGCTIVVTHPPCMDCARAIVQSGIQHVLWELPSEEFSIRWAEHRDRVLNLFLETNVLVSVVDFGRKQILRPRAPENDSVPKKMQAM